MDIESDLEIMDDDDLQLLETPNNINYSTAATKATVDNKDKEEAKKTRPNASKVWLYFDKVGLVDGVQKCKCKGCGKLYTCKAASGTNHLKRHITSCHSIPKFHDVGALLDNQATLLKKWKFDNRAYRDALSRCIIKHDLPFCYAEYDGVWEVNKVLNPEFKSISRNTAKADCMSVFLIEKAKLKSTLASIPGRVCLTSDVWTAVTTQGYMTVTAHYVDQEWKLNSKLLSFCHLDSSHTGLELSGKVLGALKDWGIDAKIFALTLDNAANNDKMITILKDRLNLQNGLLCGGKYFHVRCCAHILNIIVQEGLKAAGDALYKIRESVKYVRASEGRLRDFQRCIQVVHLSDVSGGF